MFNCDNLKTYLDQQVERYYNADFIDNDPICIPHRFTLKQDIEISGLFAAILAWGNRKSIINNCNQLMQLMDNAPYQFITQHQSTDLKRFLGFKHRTFNDTDLLYFLYFLQIHYQNFNSLEDAFVLPSVYDNCNTEQALIYFYNYFFSFDHPIRTHKHIATPAKNSACKRLNMYLRWLVRPADKGVDFGIWKKIKPSQLICPLDVHVIKTALKLGLLENEKSNWKNAEQLTNSLLLLNSEDPVIYDFALFGLSVNNAI